MTTILISADVSSGGVAVTETTSNNVLVMPNVHIVSTASVGLQFTNTVAGGTTTMDGFVYGDTIGIQQVAGGSNEKLNIYGEVQSAAIGIEADAGGAHIYVADGASVTGGNTGINVTAGTVFIENHGNIASDNFSAGYGIQVGNVVVSQILNYGYIGGVQVQSQNLLLVNFGVIEGFGASPDASSSVNVVRNYGSLNDYVVLHHGDQLLNFGDVNGNVTLNGNFMKSTGFIDGDVSDTGFTGGDIVINKGTITGDVIFTLGTNSYDGHNGHVLGTVTGGSGNDTISTGTDDDAIAGANGNDTIGGGGGDDTIDGGKGGDKLTGGKGDDQLTGGTSADTFFFSGHFGTDVITDFLVGAVAGHDIISFSLNDFADFADVQAHMTQMGADVLITLDAADTILVKNTTMASFVAGDFLFT